MTQLDLDNIKTNYSQGGKKITLGEQGIPYVRETPYSESLYNELLERVKKDKKTKDEIDLFIKYNEHLGSDSRTLARQIGGGLLGKFYSGRELSEDLESLNELGYGTEGCVLTADNIRGSFVGSFSKNIKIYAKEINGYSLCMNAENATVVTKELKGVATLNNAKNSKLIARKVLKGGTGSYSENSIVVVTDELKGANTLENSSNSILVAKKIKEPFQGHSSNNLTILASDFPKRMLNPYTYQGPFGGFFYAPKNLRFAHIEKNEFDTEWTPSNVEERIRELQRKHSAELQKVLFVPKE